MLTPTAGRRVFKIAGILKKKYAGLHIPGLLNFGSKTEFSNT